MAEKMFMQALGMGISEEMRADPKVFLMGEDVRASVYGAATGLHDEFGDDRVLNTPLSENGFFGAAVGAAAVGMRPVVETLTSFMWVGMDQLVSQAAKMRYMFGGQATLPVAKSILPFNQHGKSGQWISDLLPHHHKIADDICIIKSMHTEAINHDPACTFVMTGSEVPGKPSLGSWLSYGLGSESQNLPAFAVFTPTVKKPSQALFTRMWTSGFLPSKFDGVKLRSSGDPVLYVKNPPGSLL